MRGAVSCAMGQLALCVTAAVTMANVCALCTITARSCVVCSTLQVYDFVREKVHLNCTHHQKAVYGFIWWVGYRLTDLYNAGLC
jgi:hypothetical protein